ncbi:MAG: sigma-70 family RNA polymerase sigma factor [Deltaproteobacteria bacterium]|nr:sigma-70 family RNA polymerase sigma factor [Kofleriaceae bacterium]
MERSKRTYDTGQGLLDRESELALAAEIEARSVALWSALLAHPATAALVARVGAERPHDHALVDQAVALVAASPEPELAGARNAIVLAARELADARSRFVQANIGLVMYIANRYRSTTLSREDLVQEGMFGLIKAVDRFDHRRGLRFSTFATWWIRHHIGRAVADTGRLIRVPVHVHESRQRLRGVRDALALELERAPTREELARAADVSLEKLQQIEEAGVLREVRLDAPAGEGQDHARVEIFVDPGGDEVDAGDALDRRTLTELARELLPSLSPMEREVLRRRFGLGGDEREETFREIATDHGLSRERIRQIEASALRKLRTRLAPLVGEDELAETAA